MSENSVEPSVKSAWSVTGPSIDFSDGQVLKSLVLNGRLAETGIKEGDWLLISGKEGIAGQASRIARVRRELNAKTLFFDHATRCATDTPATASSEEPIANRLDWTVFESTLAACGFASPMEVPLIADEAYLRELLELAVRDDLLGPADGPFEFVKDMSVRDRYLVGKLAPPRRGPDEHPINESAAADQEVQIDEERDAPLHEPGAEFASTSGRVDAESDALDEADTTNNQSLIPSSLGLTFCVAPDVSEVEIRASWGSYERIPNDEHEFTKTRKNRKTGEEEQVKVRVWQRSPRGGTAPLALADGSFKIEAIDPSFPDVHLRGSVRTNSEDERLVTMFLVNAQAEPEQNKDAAWIFQPKLVISAPSNEERRDVFLRRPSAEVVVDDPERDRLALIYRDKVEFAVGHGVSVHAAVPDEAPTRATQIETVVIPSFEVPVTETPGRWEEDRLAMREFLEREWADMKKLASLEVGELRSVLEHLVDDYDAWIGSEEKRIGVDVKDHDALAKDTMMRCREAHRRLREGIDVLFQDSDALEAFRFANSAMALQRIHSIYARKRRRGEEVTLEEIDTPGNRSWRPFQLAFLLLSIRALVDPKHRDRTKPAEALADLIWFPTGGGKTEAYLGVAAFTMGIRRLKNDLGGYDASRGLSVIMRYTLRLLTLQQFQRATTLICALEMIRQKDEESWGAEPFTIGLWVGNSVTPGNSEESAKAISLLKDGGWSQGGTSSPAQLTSCPWCGSEIRPRKDIVVDKVILRTSIYCGDKLGKCAFSKAESYLKPYPGVPVKVVDEEIYHRPPSMLIATVDKFAMMAWKPEVRTLFGKVEAECQRHGLLWPGHDCGTGHRQKGPHPGAGVKKIGAIRPPDLIIQDEFHLISGPLGTMVGLYETAVDDLCSWSLGEDTVRPKVVASTATVRRAADQVRNVFMRRVAIFPPSGLDVSDNFFSVQRPIARAPGRRYLGICAPGSSRPSVLIRTYTAFLTAAQALFDRFGDVADPYMTLVGYFNSLRELGGMKRLAEDDVHTRSYRVQMSLVERPGLAQRSLYDIRELTSRVHSSDIPKYLDLLDVKYQAQFDDEEGKWVAVKGKDDPRPIDVVLATNMLSVGVDVDRLGVMVVNGQPKGTAEYIQATSRVGRVYPGLVASVLTWARPRDLSHYESFEHYHATFYQHVEAQSVTPFAPRALDRGLTGAMLSMLRNSSVAFAPNGGAGQMKTPAPGEVDRVRDAIAKRTWEVSEDADRRSFADDALKARVADWASEAGEPGRVLLYKKKGRKQPNAVDLLAYPGLKPWTNWTVPTSLREVESGVRLVMTDEVSIHDPKWQAMPLKDSDGDEQ